MFWENFHCTIQQRFVDTPLFENLAKKHWFSLYSFPKLQFLWILKIHCDVNLIWKQARFVLSYFNKGFKKLYHSYVTLQKWISIYYENPKWIFFFSLFIFYFAQIWFSFYALISEECMHLKKNNAFFKKLNCDSNFV